eukprot:761782-Hanusia_phi.AAC.2
MYVDNAAMQLIRNPKQVLRIPFQLLPSPLIVPVPVSVSLVPPSSLVLALCFFLPLPPATLPPLLVVDAFLQFDVMVTGNIFGDILSDEVTPTSLGRHRSPPLPPLRPHSPCSPPPSFFLL